MYQDDEDSTFWAAWRRVRAGEASGDDLGYVLSCAERLWQRVHDLAPKAAAYDAMRETYESPIGTTKERQSAACRAGGLTVDVAAQGQHDRVELLWRWLEVTRETRDPEQALDRLARERGIDPESAARQLHRIRAKIDEDVAAGGPEWLRLLAESLREPPARIPSGSPRKPTR